MRIACRNLTKTKVKSKLCMVLLSILSFFNLVAQGIEMKITGTYLNIPVGNDVRAKMMQLVVNGKLQREFAVQLAEDTVSYWVYAMYQHTKIKNLRSIMMVALQQLSESTRMIRLTVQIAYIKKITGHNFISQLKEDGAMT